MSRKSKIKLIRVPEDEDRENGGKKINYERKFL